MNITLHILAESSEVKYEAEWYHMVLLILTFETEVHVLYYCIFIVKLMK